MTEFTAAKSRLRLPAMGHWNSVFDYFCQHFERIGADIWQQRFDRGLVQCENGIALTTESCFAQFAGSIVYYQREVPNEPNIPFEERVVFESTQIVIADKPHFLPVAPVGAYVEQTLLRRLQRHYRNPDLIPAHRIDQGTAGLVLLVKQKTHRGAYQALFREQRVEKTYHAIAPFRAELSFPMLRRSSLVDAEHFMQMQEAEGEPNSETELSILHRIDDGTALYELKPKTGKRHQLRAQMSALGIAILNDAIYPELKPQVEALDFSKPLKLLAQRLQFVDPITGVSHDFESGFRLA